MKNYRLMGMHFNTMLVLLTAVIVLRIQMRMRRCPLEHHKGGKQKKNESRVGTSLDHDGIEFKVVFGFAAPLKKRTESIMLRKKWAKKGTDLFPPTKMQENAKKKRKSNRAFQVSLTAALPSTLPDFYLRIPKKTRIRLPHQAKMQKFVASTPTNRLPPVRAPKHTRGEVKNHSPPSDTLIEFERGFRLG